jgi:DNA-binding NarL/FixJ family response regulator
MQAGAFDPIGVTGIEERAYRLLLERPGCSLSEIARSLALSARVTRTVLEGLEGKGLVTRSADRVPRFMPARPDVAMEVLILRRQEELEKARLEATQLLDTFRSSVQRSGPSDLVEVLTRRESIVHWFDQLQASAQEEVLICDRPPYARPANPSQAERSKQGIRYRILYDQSSLEFPGKVEDIRLTMKFGEEARVMHGVPLKLAISDRRLALVPLKITENGVEGAILIHPSPLIDALRTLFELLWQSAAALRFVGDELELGPEESIEISSEDQAVLSLMASGMKDHVIAKQLGMGPRTIQRRIKGLMELVGVRSRVQLAVQSVRRGWI